MEVQGCKETAHRGEMGLTKKQTKIMITDMHNDVNVENDLSMMSTDRKQPLNIIR